MTIKVRPAEQKDKDPLTALMYEYIVDFYQRPKPPIEKVQHIFHLLLEKEEGIQFVSENEGNLLGFATLYFTYSTTKADQITVMNDLYVIEEARGKGVAQKLFKACEHYTKNNGYAHMSWITATDNDRAQRFYEKMGGVRGDWFHYTI
ncbi:N-acetyltransferase family protein [Siminovitchia sp. 179-K 8D1 HS]|uniref:GNAT family N-acetyltransferase n=1 Tax=Siminovitchia sp. 179-K 8D1 HS TaxID=3142385 RepID=UPI00399F9186